MELLQQYGQVIATWFLGLLGTNPSWDVVLLVCAGIGGVALALLGRARLVIVLMASIATVALTVSGTLLPWILHMLRVEETIWGYASVVGALVMLIFAMLSYGLAERLEEERGSISTSVVLAYAILGLLITLVFSFLEASVLQGFSAPLRSAFSLEARLPLWLLGAVLIMVATRD